MTKPILERVIVSGRDVDYNVQDIKITSKGKRGAVSLEQNLNITEL